MVTKNEKESHSGKGYGETTTGHSRFEGECRNCGKHRHRASDCWYKQTNKSQGKDKGTTKSKSKLTEISESGNSKHVDETRTPNTSAQQPNLSQVNRIGCADGLWKFSLEDSKKRRYTVNWEDLSREKFVGLIVHDPGSMILRFHWCPIVNETNTKYLKNDSPISAKRNVP